MSSLISAFGLDWKLLILQMVNFAVVLVVLWYFLYKPVMKMIDERQKRIKRGVEDAEEAAKDLKEADEQRREILSEATTEAERLVEDGKLYALDEQEKILKEARETGERTVEDATQKGQEIKEGLLRESKEEIAAMIVLGAEKVLREKEGKKK